jgi:hypothetical protein
MVCHRVTSKSKVRTQNVKSTIRGEFCVSIAVDDDDDDDDDYNDKKFRS